VCVCVCLSLSLSRIFFDYWIRTLFGALWWARRGSKWANLLAQCDNLRAWEFWGKDLATNVGYSSMLWRGNHFPLFSSLALIASPGKWCRSNPFSNCPDYGLVEMSRSSREVERANNTNVVSSFLEILFLGFRA
jgi:hypothetical protein